MILLTGAAGKTGQAVLKALNDRGESVRVFVRSRDQAEELSALGAAQAIVGHLQDRAALQEAMDRADTAYHIPPNVNPDEIEIGRAVISAAIEAGVGRFVFHSVLHPQTEAMPHHWKKLRVEEVLLQTHLEWTILQPCAYMQNVLAGWEAIAEGGVYRVPYGLDARLSIVDLEDVAEAAAIVLTQPGHAGATYELAGLKPLSQIEIAGLLSAGLGREVKAERLPLETWEAGALDAGLGEYAREALLAMFRYYDSHGLIGNPNALTWLLGRPPTSFEAFVERVVRDRRSRSGSANA